MRSRVEDLALEPGLELASSPRHADVLLVAGEIPLALQEAVYRVHDQVPRPRASLWWGSATPDALPDPMVVTAGRSPVQRLRSLTVAMRAGQRHSEPDLLPDQPPAPWHGQGPYGQGGEGMMGGKPYGRPMAMTGDDLRDGLALDELTLEAGPFLPLLPPGLIMQVTLQGDVIQHVSVRHPPFTDNAPLYEARPLSLAVVETARVAHHLRCVARLLAVLGLSWPALRCLRAARAASDLSFPEAARQIRSAVRWVCASAVQHAVSPGIGRLEADVLRLLGGTAARAAGEGPDPRAQQDCYRRLGFKPLMEGSGDVRARLRLWVREVQQSLALAQAAGPEVQTAPDDEASTPQPVDIGDCIDPLLRGLEWQQAAMVLASFDPQALGRLATGPQH
jgi:hypothetical protein